MGADEDDNENGAVEAGKVSACHTMHGLDCLGHTPAATVQAGRLSSTQVASLQQPSQSMF